MDKDDTVQRPQVRLTRKMKKALRAQIKKKKELKINFDEDIISDSDSSISEDLDDDKNNEMDNIYKVEDEQRPLVELNHSQNRIEEADGFMRVLSDRLFMHLDSIWKRKEAEVIDSVAREEMVNMWHLAVSSLYGVSTWGKGIHKNDGYNASNMMMNIAWWRLFSDNWDKIETPRTDLCEVLDRLLVSVISTKQASRYINHIGVYFL